MTITRHFFDPATGEIALARYVGSPDQLEANTPAGAVPLEADADPLSQRVTLVTDDMGDQQPVVVDWVPPAPADDEWRTWVWDADNRRWVEAPTLAARKRDAVAALQRQIEAIEIEQARPQRELFAALLAGQQPPSEPRQRLQEIEAAILPLRARRAAIEAARSGAELDIAMA